MKDREREGQHRLPSFKTINMNGFEELIKLRERDEGIDLTQEQNNKLIGECVPGCRVEIYWTGEDKIIDEGYVFVVDGMDADIGDCFVHIPHPENPGGKDAAHGRWTYMITLMSNHLVEKIVCLHSQK